MLYRYYYYYYYYLAFVTFFSACPFFPAAPESAQITVCLDLQAQACLTAASFWCFSLASQNSRRREWEKMKKLQKEDDSEIGTDEKALQWEVTDIYCYQRTKSWHLIILTVYLHYIKSRKHLFYNIWFFFYVSGQYIIFFKWARAASNAGTCKKNSHEFWNRCPVNTLITLTCLMKNFPQPKILYQRRQILKRFAVPNIIL